MTLPKPTADTEELFAAVLPANDRVATRPMSGQMSAFVNGNMFAGIFGDGMFVRLKAERVQLLAEPGAFVFEPMQGRSMKEYVLLPPEWRAHPERIREWMERSLAYIAAMPPKAPKPRKKQR